LREGNNLKAPQRYKAIPLLAQGEDTEGDGPFYLDAGSEFEQGKASLRNPKWRKPTEHPCKAAFAASSRKHFSNKDERSRWITIEELLATLIRPR
jgi:hypothetical protein